MCTSLRYKSCFGRNYDYEKSYDEEIRRVKRNEFDNEYAIIGVCAGLVEDFPLFYDAMNEYGLCMSGLAFSGNAYYKDYDEIPYGHHIYNPYSFILDILGEFRNVSEVKERLKYSSILDESYSKDFPNTDLHWIISDKEQTIVVEATEEGLGVYDNPFEVLTNNPPFPMMRDEINFNLEHNIGNHGEYDGGKWTSRGTETLGLKGDYTSAGRFERAAYLRKKLLESDTLFSDVCETFHLLRSVEQIYGGTPVADSFEYTIYSVVYDLEELSVEMRTYDDGSVVKKLVV